MPDSHVGVYVKLLCLAWSKDGITYQEAQSVSRDDDAISAVIDGKFYECGDGKFRNAKLEKVREFSQKQSQNGAKSKPNTKPNGKPNPEPHIQNQNQNQNQKTEPEPEPRNTPQTPKGVTCDEFLKRWNNFASKRPKVKPARKLTSKRREKIATRLKDPGWFDDFREAIKCLPLPGDGWQPGIDWLVRNEHNIYLLLEGEYDWRGKDDPASQRLAARRRQEAFEARQAEEELRRRKTSQSVPGTRNVIENILQASDGDHSDDADRSLLFGEDRATDISSASGAASSSERSSSRVKKSD